MASATQEPILSRIDRLDYLLRQLEEIRGCNRSPKSSCASTPTSGSDGRVSSVDFSPRSLEKHCRPMESVMMETEAKGTVIERLNQAEDRLLKVFLQVEEDLLAKSNKMNNGSKKSFKELVKKCVRARRTTHNNIKEP
ncbi:hypothetical protein PHAVU_011G211600 [Phaseolus vulgaris]|uniref:Uncharacterized protein n=1 Tax=Phaseolus vulgaris TaxID=3885 RepID=V7AJV9_PHAVU|nr:hypothetical protein PHAVU_011G211600g [Phaseolus vulgaris]ESW05814.1 hypothetical protein PHAVU_011G211600g [Phaseolus vulgaris]